MSNAAAHAMLQLSSDPSAIVSADGRIRAGNTAFGRLFRTEPAALAGRSLTEVTGIDALQMREIAARCSRTSGLLPFAATLPCANNSSVRWHIEGMLLERGGAADATTICLRLRPTVSATHAFQRLNEEITQLKREIQARQRAELALRESEARLGGIISSAMDAIISIDERQRITDFNQAAEVMFRCPAAEAVGQPIDRFIPERFRAAHAQHVEAFGRTQVSKRQMGSLGTISGRRLDGDEFPIEASISQLVTESGRFYTVILRDVTERQRAEEALRESEERFRLLVQHSVHIIWRTGPDGCFIGRQESWERFTGQSFEDYQHFGGLAAIHPDDRQTVQVRWRQVMDAPGPFRSEYRLRDRHGQYRHVVSRGIPMLDAEGSVREWIGSIEDVSDRKRDEEALRQHTRSLEVINRIGTTLAAQLDLEKLVQAVTDAGREASGAQFGAFFHNVTNETGETYMLYTLSGVPRDAFAKFPMPRNTAIFDPTFKGKGIIRLDDVLQDPRYGKNAPYQGMPEGHLPVRSYLAVPVTSRSGEVLGGLFYGHADPHVFTEEAEQIVAAIAAQAAIAMDNARLYGEAQKEIAERIRVEEALREANDRYELVLAGGEAAIWDWDVPRRVVVYSSRWKAMRGLADAEVTDAEEEWSRGIHPEDAPRVMAAVQAHFRGDTPFFAEEYRVCRQDGTWIWIADRGLARRDADGRVIRMAGAEVDITERKRGEEAIANLAAIVTSSSAAIVGLDLQGMVTSWNQAAERLYGYGAKEIIGQPVLRLIPHDRRHEEPRLLEQIAAGQLVEHFETVRIRKDGTEVNVALSVSPVVDFRGRIIGASKIAHDITERKRAETALLAANEALQQQKTALAEAVKELEGFSYSVSHDLRAPLRTIDAFSRIIHEEHGALLDAEARRCLDIVRRAAAQAGELIDDLLELSRLGRQQMQIRSVNMVELVHETVEDLRRIEKGRTIELDVGPLPPCRGDRRLLKLVWANLIGNAFKYTQYVDVARIEIGWLPDETQADAVVYYVRDNGVGFNMKYVHKLFGVFQRLHHKEDFDGTGVGLAIVRRIIQRHGGRAWAEGKVDAGATFYFSLGKASA